MSLPYRVAVLCYLYDGAGRVLLLHRLRPPNRGFYSPIGGKLETGQGEGPHDCAKREVLEEAGVVLSDDEMRLTGVVSEAAYEGETHWLIFMFEVMRPIGHDEIATMDMDEGVLEWVPIEDVDARGIPDTDRRILWPLVSGHRGGFFVVHIDCTKDDMTWTVQESFKQSP